MDPNYNDEQQRYLSQLAAQNQGLAPIQPPIQPPSSATGGFVNWVKANPWWTVIVVAVIILLLWWFCFRKKTSTAEITVTPTSSGIPRTGTVTVNRVRGNGSIY